MKYSLSIRLARSLLRLCLLMALLVAPALPLAAQAAQAAPVSFDVLVGGGHGSGFGTAVDRDEMGGELTVVARVRAANSRSLIVGLDAARVWQLNGDLVCVVTAPSGQCAPQFPGLASVSAIAGEEWRVSSRLTLRVDGGPGYYIGYVEHNSETVGAFGVHARGDVAIALIKGLSVTLGGRDSWVPRMISRSMGFMLIDAGLRLDLGQ